MRVKYMYFAQEHNTMVWPGLKPGPLALESGMLTIRPPHLPGPHCIKPIVIYCTVHVFVLENVLYIMNQSCGL